MPSGELATVLVRLTADASDFIAAMDQADKSLKKLALGAAELVGAGVLIGGALTAATEYASKYETEIFNLSQRTGIATETFSALAIAADAQGKSLDSVQVAFRQLAREAENAASGQAKAKATFDAIGVSVKDSTGRLKELNELFPEVDEGLSKVGDSTERVGLANDLYGRSSLSLITVLGGGIEKLNQFAQIASITGTMVTESQAQQGKAFQLMQMMAEDALKGLTITIGNILMPRLAELAKSIEFGVETFTSWIKQYPVLIDLAANLAVALAGAGGLLLAVTGLTAGITLLTGVMGAAAGPFAILTTAAAAAIAVVFTFRNEINQLVTTMVGGFLSGLSTLVGAIGTLAGKVGLDGLRDKLMAMKFSLEESTESWAVAASEYAVAGNQAYTFDQRLKSLMDQLKGLGGGFVENYSDAKKFQEGVDRLIDSVTNEIKTGPQLVAALEAMTNAHVDENTIVDKLGPKIISYTDALIKQGKSVDAVTQYYRDLALARQVDTTNAERQFDASDIVGKALEKNAAQIQAYINVQGDADNQLKTLTTDWLKFYTDTDRLLTQALGKSRDYSKERIDLIGQELNADTTYQQKIKDLTLASQQTKQEADTAYAAFHQTVLDMQSAADAGYSEATIKQLQNLADQQLKTWKEFYDEYVKLTGAKLEESQRYWAHFYTSQAEADQQMEFDMAKAMGDITTNFVKGIDDMIFNGKSFGDALRSIAESTAKDMLNSFLKGLFNPFKNELQQLGKDVADWATGATNKIAGLANSLTGTLGIVAGVAAGIGALFGSLFGGQSDYQKWVDSVTKQGYTIVSKGVAEKFENGYITGALIYQGSFATGTGYVPQTGPYLLHQGEAVLTAGQNDRMVGLLSAILDAVISDRMVSVNINGNEIINTVYRASRFGGAQVIGQQ